jgi:hypothetical protein
MIESLHIPFALLAAAGVIWLILWANGLKITRR